MIGTERALWRTLSAASDPRDQLTRIETGVTMTGVSDVEYVFRTTGHHGWVELKTFAIERDDRPFTLHSPFTFAQASWLLLHHMPEHKLVSWLLLGRLGPRTWKEFILVPPDIAVTRLMEGRRRPTVDKLVAARTRSTPQTIFRCRDAKEVLHVMRSV